MAMRVDKIIMLAVVGVGIYAVIRMAKTTAGAQQGLPPGGSRPVPLSVPTGTLPDLPGSVGTPPTGLAVDTTPAGQPLHLQGGRWYHGRLELTPSASREQVDMMLRQMGFGREAAVMPHAYDVQVFTTPLEASKSIFHEFALQNPGKGTRWFLARWPLSIGEVSVPAPTRPTSMVLLWAAKSPGPELVQAP
jgi:hypothetical protein